MPLLSHYTSQAGLEGIARSKCLWATDFLELNDNSEMEYGPHPRGAAVCSLIVSPRLQPARLNASFTA